MATETYDSSKANFLQNNGFRLIIPSFRELEFFSTRFTFPGMVLPAARQETPFKVNKYAGDKVEFLPLQFTFLIDEKMDNYCYIMDWMASIAYSTEFPDYTNYPNKTDYQRLGEQDISVSILNSKNNPIRTFRFYNAIPIDLAGYELNTEEDQTDYIRATVTFDYDYYVVEKHG